MTRIIHTRVIRRAACALMLGLTVVLVERPPEARQGSVEISGTSHEDTTFDMPGLTAATSRCQTSPDPTYGTTDNPIKLGGPGHPASREISYMHALRGPAGQGLHFGRVGSLNAGGTILDLYLVNYPGIAEPRKLYIDGYHSSPPQAPVGWLCGVPIDGVVPPAEDPLAHSMLMALAVKLGDGKISPISLDPDGSSRHGVVFDHVRLIAFAERAATSHGMRLDPAALPVDLARPRTIVVAYPTTCHGKTVVPESIVYTAGTTIPQSAASKTRGDAIADLIPGFRPPAGALAAVYERPWFFENAEVTVMYGSACDGNPSKKFVANVQDGGYDKRVSAAVPAGVSVSPDGAQVLLQVYFDADGVPIFPMFAGGTWQLKDAAIEAAMKWRLKPVRINGAPIFDWAMVAIDFAKR